MSTFKRDGERLTTDDKKKLIAADKLKRYRQKHQGQDPPTMKPEHRAPGRSHPARGASDILAPWEGDSQF